jgi:prepilin signal peptidase PulO-like enzyme (type II secretory pathway)
MDAAAGAETGVSRISEKCLEWNRGVILGVEEMSRLAFALFIATGLFFAAYFGAAAWRLLDDGHMDVTGTTAK